MSGEAVVEGSGVQFVANVVEPRAPAKPARALTRTSQAMSGDTL